MKPTDIAIDPVGCIVDTLGRVELEFVAALIVRWHHLYSPDEWKPVSRAELALLFGFDETPPDELVAGWARNPFWRPDPMAFWRAGFITEWDRDATARGTLTTTFFAGLARRYTTPRGDA